MHMHMEGHLSAAALVFAAMEPDKSTEEEAKHLDDCPFCQRRVSHYAKTRKTKPPHQYPAAE